MSTNTEFILIRHGQTMENRQGIIQGQRNTLLDALGIRQAECAAQRLAAERFDAIYSSDLARAMDTAGAIASHYNMEIIPCPALREWNLGELEGRPRCELEEQYEELIKSFNFDYNDIQAPGGESRAELNRRVATCLDELAQRHTGQKLLLVTHAGTMRAIFRHITGPVCGNMLPRTDNGSYSRFFRHIHGWQLCVWNDVSHLAGAGCHDSITF